VIRVWDPRGFWLIPVVPPRGAALLEWRRAAEEEAVLRMADPKSRRSRERAATDASSDAVPCSWMLLEPQVCG